MKIRFALREIAERRGITNAYQLQKVLQSPPSKASRLWKGEMDSIAFDTLAALCAALKCKPNDLLRFEPNGGE
jgi:DNA-binding Xre family transcriptional regulator